MAVEREGETRTLGPVQCFQNSREKNTRRVKISSLPSSMTAHSSILTSPGKWAKFSCGPPAAAAPGGGDGIQDARTQCPGEPPRSARGNPSARAASTIR